MIQYWFENHRELRRQRDEEGFDGFTLIELLIVIVVLGILAATVIFALGGVTGQSAQAACNSDAKTTEVSVQAYISSPDNTTNTPPTAMSDLYTAPFNSTGNPLKTGTGDTFETVQNNKAFGVYLGGTAAGDGNGDNVWVSTANPPTAASAKQYDSPVAGATNPCAAAT